MASFFPGPKNSANVGVYRHFSISKRLPGALSLGRKHLQMLKIVYI